MAQGDEKLGRYGKYTIGKATGEVVDPQGEYFVLRLDELNIPDEHTRKHRVASRRALQTYAQCCGNPKLAEELVELIRAVEAREHVLRRGPVK